MAVIESGQIPEKYAVQVVMNTNEKDINRTEHTRRGLFRMDSSGPTRNCKTVKVKLLIPNLRDVKKNERKGKVRKGR